MICTFYAKFNNVSEWTEFKHSKLVPVMSWYAKKKIKITAFFFVTGDKPEVIVYYEDTQLNRSIVKKFLNIGLNPLSHHPKK